MKKRPRGVISPVQRKGFELMQNGAVTLTGGGVATVTYEDGRKSLPNLEREECSCDPYRYSKPRMWCACLWAAAYYTDPPDLDELNVSLTTAQPVQKPASPIIIAKSMTDADIQNAKNEIILGGYKRHAAAYDEATRSDFLKTVFFVKALFEEISGFLVWRPQLPRGRNQIPLSRVLLSVFMKTYFKDWSLRRTEGFMRFLADERISVLAHNDYPDFALMGQFLRDPNATPLLRCVLALTAEPFREIGSLRLAADGSGIGSNVFYDYRCEARDKKKQARGKRISWHVHAIVGVDTLHVVTLRVSDPKKSSEKTILQHQLLPELATLDYEIDDFLADGGYNATMIRDAILDMGAMAWIPWNKNAKNAIPRQWKKVVKHADIIKVLFSLCMTEPAKFREYYRFRVKIESFYSSLKQRYGGHVRSLHGAGPENEILLKCICHNIHMLLLAAECYGLDITGPLGMRGAA